MKRNSWRLALCASIFAVWSTAAVAQQNFYAGAAREANSGGSLDQFTEKISPGVRQKRKTQVLNMLPDAEKADFHRYEPRDTETAMQYYDIVQGTKGRR